MSKLRKYLLLVALTAVGFYSFAWLSVIPAAAMFPGYELKGGEEWKKDAAMILGMVLGIGGALFGASIALFISRPPRNQ